MSATDIARTWDGQPLWHPETEAELGDVLRNIARIQANPQAVSSNAQVELETWESEGGSIQ